MSDKVAVSAIVRLVTTCSVAYGDFSACLIVRSDSHPDKSRLWPRLVVQNL